MENKHIFDIKARYVYKHVTMVYLNIVLGTVCRVMEVVDLFFNFRLYVRLQVREIS